MRIYIIVVTSKLKYSKIKNKSRSGSSFTHIKTWEMFHGTRRPGYQIHHIDGNPTNNNITNLVELKTNYHQLYHKLSKILNKTMKNMNVYIGMIPKDSDIFYKKLDTLAKQFKIDTDTSEFAKRRSVGSGLSKEESIKKRMIASGKLRIKLGKPAYDRGSTTATNVAKENAKKYFGSVDAYITACRN